MIVTSHRFYDFDWDAAAGILTFAWKSETASMADADFKAALSAFAAEATAQGAGRVLVDLREFRHQQAGDIGPWRDEHITPRYNAAGVRRFAYLMPTGQIPPPVGQDGKPAAPGESFVTRFFAAEEEARGWLLA